jgi:putative membrane protein
LGAQIHQEVVEQSRKGTRMLYVPTILASLHHVAAFTLVACLFYEWLIFRQRLSSNEVRGLQQIDLWYGISSLVLLCAGILRVLYGGKVYTYYMGNALFWVKMFLILSIGILSIYPTIRYIRWGTIDQEGLLVPDAEFQRIRSFLRIQMIGLVLVIIIAPAMARGLWLF